MSDHVGAVMRHGIVIQLVDKLCNVCFKLKHLFLLSLHLVDNLVKNVDEHGSEHHVQTHINEPPCSNLGIEESILVESGNQC